MKAGVLTTMMTLLMLVGFSLAAQAGPATDMDSDGTIDGTDTCKLDPVVPNPCGFDTDTDGYGNGCDGDFTNDGAVDFLDIPPFGADLGGGVDSGIGSDMNCDGAVDFLDIPFFGAQLGAGVPGPSGLSCAGTSPCP